MDDEELLSYVQRERQNSIGFDQDSELVSARELALNYAKGIMPDIASLDNRSKAVSTDVADAIETVMPDLMEIFTGGDDVVAFIANSEADEKGAGQETDYLNNVFFQQNEGFLTLYSAMKDALLTKVGIIKWWWDEAKGEVSEDFEGKTAMDVQVAAQSSEIKNLKPSKYDEDDGPPPEQLFDFTAYQKGGRACIASVAPEDFTVAKDTISLEDATYCAMRSRPRVQDLIAQGLDRDKVEDLPLWGSQNDGTTAQARDTVAEQLQSGVDATGNLRMVELIEHYIRIEDGESGRLQLWKVQTGGNETVLLMKEKVGSIPFASATPYIVPHRFYGESVADKLLEIQRIKTALMRMLLDSGYFALNQRTIVDETKTTQFTLSDLMRNEPNMPIRVKGEGAVLPFSAGGLDFDATGALEFFSTVAEGRTGIVRNAQGLNPDTLHETATGAIALISAAQKRVRMIARIFAETMVKNAYLGIHAMLRENATQADTIKLEGSWTEIDPTKWGSRSAMTVQVGLGAAGKEHDIMALQQMLPVMEQIVTAQGGINGPIITAQNVYNFYTMMFQKLGFKNGEQYATDPTKAPPQPPKPDPEAIKAQLQGQQQQAQTAQAQAELQVKGETDARRLLLETQQSQASSQLASEKLARDDAFRHAQLQSNERIEAAKLSQAPLLEHARLTTDVATNSAKIDGSFKQAVTVQAMKGQIAQEQMASDLAIQQSEASDVSKEADDG